MVTTKAHLKEQKRQTFYVKEDYPPLKHMSKADAVAYNNGLKKDREKLNALEVELKNERAQQVNDDLRVKELIEKDGLSAKAAKALVAEENTGKAKRETDGDGNVTETDMEKQIRIDAENTKITIDGLEVEFAKAKGPGSKARKDELREKINALKG